MLSLQHALCQHCTSHFQLVKQQLMVMCTCITQELLITVCFTSLVCLSVCLSNASIMSK